METNQINNNNQILQQKRPTAPNHNLQKSTSIQGQEQLTPKQKKLLSDFRTAISPQGPSKAIQNFNSTSNILTKESGLSLNAEDLIIQESKLYKILDNIRSNLNFNYVAEEYVEFINISSLQPFENYFENKKFKKNLCDSQIFELISVMTCEFIYLKNMLFPCLVEHIKNILFYVHQNLILIIELLIKKIKIEYNENIWVKKLREAVNTKKSIINVKDSDIQTSIEQNNNILYNCLGNFILIYFNNKQNIKTFTVLNDILCNLNQCSYETVKNNLTNLKNLLVYITENEKNSYIHINLEGPFLPKNTTNKEYSLVLDLDETLIHCLDQEEIQPLIRPGAQKFLEEMSKYYEIIIFTAGLKSYADAVLNILDPENKYIDYKLYRDHTTVLKRTYLKDLSKLGRELSKTIIIDNAYDNFQLQSENGIFINTWIDDMNDNSLYDLIPILKEIAVKKVKDVRKALRKVRDTMIRFYVKGDPQPFSTILHYIKGEIKLPH